MTFSYIDNNSNISICPNSIMNFFFHHSACNYIYKISVHTNVIWWFSYYFSQRKINYQIYNTTKNNFFKLIEIQISKNNFGNKSLKIHLVFYETFPTIVFWYYSCCCDNDCFFCFWSVSSKHAQEYFLFFQKTSNNSSNPLFHSLWGPSLVRYFFSQTTNITCLIISSLHFLSNLHSCNIFSAKIIKYGIMLKRIFLKVDLLISKILPRGHFFMTFKKKKKFSPQISFLSLTISVFDLPCKILFDGKLFSLVELTFFLFHLIQFNSLHHQMFILQTEICFEN